MKCPTITDADEPTKASAHFRRYGDLIIRFNVDPNKQDLSILYRGKIDDHNSIVLTWQVISIDLRSKFDVDTQMTDDSIRNEINYCEILNRVLPKEIRCTAWQPLYSREFSARFDCRLRTYRYFLPRSNLNIEAMQTACGYLIGAHDFRNLCKMDVANGVVKFNRELYEVKIVPAYGCDERTVATDPYAMMYVQLTGKAFLWHQVRAIIAVLLLIGQGKEKPEVIQELLDVEKNPCTPQYSLASDIPLNLFNVEMDTISRNGASANERPGETIGWIYDSFTLARVISTLQQQWTKISARSQMTMEMLQVLEGIYETECKAERIFDHTLAIQDGAQPKRYQPLMTRSKCSKFNLLQTGIFRSNSMNFVLYLFQVAWNIASSTMQRSVASKW